MVDAASVLVTGTAAFVMGAIGMSVAWWVHRREVPALAWWLASSLVLPFGVLFIALRGRVPDVLSLEAGNGLLFLGLSLAVRGHAVWAGRSRSPAVTFAAPLVATTLVAFFHFVVPHVGYRGVVHGVYLMWFYADQSWLMWQPPSDAERLPARTIAVVSLFAAFLGLVRALASVGQPPDAPLLASNSVVALTMAFSVSSALLLQLLRLLLAGARLLQKERELVADLGRAAENIRTLEGLLPQCAWCHRIEDTTKEWVPLARYVKEHTHAKVTHGLCPDCERSAFKPEASPN